MLLSHRFRFLIVELLGTAVFLVAAGAPAGRRPSLDDLVTRASAYWELLAKGQRSKAVEYVQPLTREVFLDRQTPAFSEPRVARLDLSETPDEVWVTVKVKRILPLIPTPVDWPVKEKWVHEGGKWVVVITKSDEKFARVNEAQPRAPATNPDQEKKLESIREKLHFENNKIDFGTVRRGAQVPIELQYRLTGNDTMAWKLKDLPRWLTRKMSGSKDLAPGEGQKIELSLLTQELEGEISETFTIMAGNAGVEAPYEFSIHGYVYTPVSISPRPLKFLRGETANEVVLKNNSRSPIQLISAKAAGFEVEGLPQTIAPGAECRLSVKLKFRSYGTNYGGEITLRFAEPVDGIESIALPVIVNFEPPKTWRRSDWEQLLPTPRTPD